jgi:hypothetical protein
MAEQEDNKAKEFIDRLIDMRKTLPVAETTKSYKTYLNIIIAFAVIFVVSLLGAVAYGEYLLAR